MIRQTMFGVPARNWGFCPKHGLSQALSDYLVPAMKKRYAAIAKQ